MFNSTFNSSTVRQFLYDHGEKRIMSQLKLF